MCDEPEDRPVCPAADERVRTYCNDNVLCILVCKVCKVCTKLGILTALGILIHCVTEARLVTSSFINVHTYIHQYIQFGYLKKKIVCI